MWLWSDLFEHINKSIQGIILVKKKVPKFSMEVATIPFISKQKCQCNANAFLLTLLLWMTLIYLPAYSTFPLPLSLALTFLWFLCPSNIHRVTTFCQFTSSSIYFLSPYPVSSKCTFHFSFSYFSGWQLCTISTISMSPWYPPFTLSH